MHKLLSLRRAIHAARHGGAEQSSPPQSFIAGASTPKHSSFLTLKDNNARHSSSSASIVLIKRLSAGSFLTLPRPVAPLPLSEPIKVRNSQEIAYYRKNSKLNHVAKFRNRIPLEKIELVRTIGTGSFGRVYMARIKDNKSPPVAVKKLVKSSIIKQKQVEHVLSEREILSQIEHPFLVSVSRQLFQSM